MGLQVIDWLMQCEMAAQKNQASLPKLCLKYKQLLDLVSDQTMPTVYRSACCQLLKCIYLDREPRETILPGPNTQVMSSANMILPGSNMQFAVRQEARPFEDFPLLEPPSRFNDLQQWIVTSITLHHELPLMLSDRSNYVLCTVVSEQICAYSACLCMVCRWAF